MHKATCLFGWALIWRGAVFVDELDQVPDGFIVIFSAHGVSQAVRMEGERRGLKVFDATCPLVTKVHLEVTKYSREGRECILIGHAGHPEVEGTMGQYDTASGGSIYLVEDEDDVAKLEVRDPEALAFVTQTTLSVYFHCAKLTSEQRHVSSVQIINK